MSEKQIRRKLRALTKKYPEEQYLVLRASNGEVAIVTKKWHDMCKRRPVSEP